MADLPSKTLTPEQKELIRLCRKPDPDGQDARMLRHWLLCQNPTNVEGEDDKS